MTTACLAVNPSPPALERECLAYQFKKLAQLQADWVTKVFHQRKYIILCQENPLKQHQLFTGSSSQRTLQSEHVDFWPSQLILQVMVCTTLALRSVLKEERPPA
ncbi:uncharacterized protein J5F26_011676 isoform 1-T1 [Ciconia maguari]